VTTESRGGEGKKKKKKRGIETERETATDYSCAVLPNVATLVSVWHDQQHAHANSPIETGARPSLSFVLHPPPQLIAAFTLHLLTIIMIRFVARRRRR